MTSGSIWPNITVNICVRNRYSSATKKTDTAPSSAMSCWPALQASSFCLCPIYWPATAAPPVAIAEKM